MSKSVEGTAIVFEHLPPLSTTEPVAWLVEGEDGNGKPVWVAVEKDPSRLYGPNMPIVPLVPAASISQLNSRIGELERKRDEAYALAQEYQRQRNENFARAEASEAELAEARKVIEPFSKFADALNEQVPDDIAIGIFADGGMRFGPSGGANVGDLRRARSFHSPKKPDGGANQTD